MRKIIQWLIPMLLLFSLSASAADVAGLAECTTKVFTEISRTEKWSGKTPAGCRGKIAVERRADGIFVIIWDIQNGDGGWVKTAFAAGMGNTELNGAKKLAAASHDIVSRARHIGRCLDSINTINDPLDCKDRATKSYLAGDVTGTENTRLIWLDDNGRHTVAEYSFGTSAITPTAPADLFGGHSLPPGMVIDLHLRDN